MGGCGAKGGAPALSLGSRAGALPWRAASPDHALRVQQQRVVAGTCTTDRAHSWARAARGPSRDAGERSAHLAAAASLDSSWSLLAAFSFSSRISLNFLMFSKNSGLRLSVMKSLAFLLSPRLLEA